MNIDKKGCATTGNRRLDDMIRKAVDMGVGGGKYMLDCYMGKTFRSDISHTITTRTATDNNTFIMDVYEETDTDKHDRRMNNIKGISVHPFSHAKEFYGKISEDVSPCLRATDYKAPHCVWEIEVYEDEE